MDSPFKTPEKRSVKVTYTNRNRKLGGKKATDEGDSEVSECNAGVEDAEAETSGVKKQVSRISSLNLPGPVPRLKRSSSRESISRKNNTLDSPRTPGESGKPLSMLGSKLALASKKRVATTDSDGKPPAPASDTSDKASIARAIHTKESERLAYFEAHPDVAEFEPHRVRCRCCGKWLKLRSTQRYALAPWKAHNAICSSNKPMSKRLSLSTDPDAVPEKAEDADDAQSVAPSVSVSVSASEAASVSGAGRRRRTTDEERQRALEADELTGEVRADAVFCARCEKWVRLRGKTKFALAAWVKHAVRVHGRGVEESARLGAGAPSNRVREAERKLQLVNDVQAKDFSAGRVTCAVCQVEVPLSETTPYQLDNWLEHKASCSQPTELAPPAPTSPSATHPEASSASASSPSATRSAEGSSTASTAVDSKIAGADASPRVDTRPPSSTTSSADATCVNTDSAAVGRSSAPPQSPLKIIGHKRQREEVEGGEDEEGKVGSVGERGEGSGVRPRTASYVPRDEKTPSPWGWVWLPWETFKKGFAEGFRAGASPPPLPPSSAM